MGDRDEWEKGRLLNMKQLFHSGKGSTFLYRNIEKYTLSYTGDCSVRHRLTRIERKIHHRLTRMEQKSIEIMITR